MCCFSGPVEEVSATSIFARRVDQKTQAIVYQMHFQSLEDLAMILPIPTPPKSDERAVKFISLEKYQDFFADMRLGFPTPPLRGAVPAAGGLGNALGEEPLEVVDVGAFEASFVPSLKDFARLDERFRIDDKLWAKLPKYADFGFAVFKLKKGEHNVHPMAFTFPTALEKATFFPTVHIHDQKVHDEAEFDHVLYLQTDAILPRAWNESPQPAGMFMDKKRAGDLIAPNAHVHRLKIQGRRKNSDIVV